MTNMEFDVRPIYGGFAREVVGLDLWKPLAGADVEALRRAWTAAGVLVFRRQSLSEDELAEFSGRFGALEVHPRADWNSRANPYILNLSNLRNFAGDEIGGLGAGEIDWHTDQSYKLRPGTGAVLYGVELPKGGTPTYFANLRLAYAALPDETKRRIDGARAVYDYALRTAGYSGKQPDPDEVRRRFPPVSHRLVNADPVTGERALYLDPLTMAGIVGWPEAEARATIDALARHATQARFVYRHDWRAGDVVMWDNGFMLHRREPVGDAPRLLKRTTMALPPDRHIVPEGVPCG
jgi:alpha-ketoglutarate-dependent taurine dioxygenase